MPGRHVELAVVPPGALRLACRADISLRIAVEYRDELRVGREIRYPTTVDRDEPEVACLIESTSLEKFPLRFIVNVGKQRDRPDTWRRRRHTPRLHGLRRRRTCERRRWNCLILRHGRTYGRC